MCLFAAFYGFNYNKPRNLWVIVFSGVTNDFWLTVCSQCGLATNSTQYTPYLTRVKRWQTKCGNAESCHSNGQISNLNSWCSILGVLGIGKLVRISLTIKLYFFSTIFKSIINISAADPFRMMCLTKFSFTYLSFLSFCCFWGERRQSCGQGYHLLPLNNVESHSEATIQNASTLPLSI